MTVTAVPGTPQILIGPFIGNMSTGTPIVTAPVLDAANEAVIMIGQVVTSDGGSHTIDTSGSSAIGWATNAVTIGTTTAVSVGIAAVDLTAGPPARAVAVADVITLDVAAVFVGSGITANAWQTSVPTTGTKTIANGDFVAICIQMTVRAGADVVRPQGATKTVDSHRPITTIFVGGGYTGLSAPAAPQPVGGGYTAANFAPNAIITFADGALGWLQESEISTTINTRTWNSGSAAVEYGQLYEFPFPMKIYGLYGFVDPDANFDMVLYTDPLGTPVAAKTVAIDLNAVTSATGRRIYVMFDSPVTTTGASNISTYYRTIANAAYRIADIGGTSSMGVARASGAFAAENSNLDHYYIGLIVGAFDDAAGGGGGLLRHPGTNGGLNG